MNNSKKRVALALSLTGLSSVSISIRLDAQLWVVLITWRFTLDSDFIYMCIVIIYISKNLLVLAIFKSQLNPWLFFMFFMEVNHCFSGSTSSSQGLRWWTLVKPWNRWPILKTPSISTWNRTSLTLFRLYKTKTSKRLWYDIISLFIIISFYRIIKSAIGFCI